MGLLSAAAARVRCDGGFRRLREERASLLNSREKAARAQLSDPKVGTTEAQREQEMVLMPVIR
jgi:hypothetical protein